MVVDKKFGDTGIFNLFGMLGHGGKETSGVAFDTGKRMWNSRSRCSYLARAGELAVEYVVNLFGGFAGDLFNGDGKTDTKSWTGRWLDAVKCGNV